MFTLNATSLSFLYFYQLKCRSTLRISGLVPSAYWCGQAAIDVPFYYLILTCMTSTLFAFHSTNLLTSHNIMSVVRKCLAATGLFVTQKLFKLKQQNRQQLQCDGYLFFIFRLCVWLASLQPWFSSHIACPSCLSESRAIGISSQWSLWW